MSINRGLVCVTKKSSLSIIIINLKYFLARKEISDLVKVLLQLALLVFLSPHINHRNLFISKIFVQAVIKIRRRKAQDTSKMFLIYGDTHVLNVKLLFGVQQET